MLSSGRLGPRRYHSEIATTMNGPEAVAVTVIDLPPCELESSSAYYTLGRIIAQRFPDGTKLYPDRHTLVGSPGTRTAPAESMESTLTYGIGRVEECNYSLDTKRWIVKVLHRDWDDTSYSTVSFHVEYTLPQRRMERIGADLFQVRRVLALNGDIFG